MKKLLSLVTLFMVVSIHARTMTDRSQDGGTQISRGTTRTRAARRPVRSGRPQQRSPQGRLASRTQQRPVTRSTEQIIPSAGGGPSVPAPGEQPVSTNAGLDAKKWRSLRISLLQKKGLPSKVLEDIKKIRERFELTDEQEGWLDLFEQWMEWAQSQKPGQLVGESPAEKSQQLTASVEPLAPPAGGGPSILVAPAANPFLQTPQPPVIQNNPFISAQPTATKKQGALQQWYNDPNKKILGVPVSNASAAKQTNIQSTASTNPFLQESQSPAIQAQNNPFISNTSTTPKKQGALQQWYNDPKKTFLGIPVSNAPASTQENIQSSTPTNNPFLTSPPASPAEIDPVTGRSLVPNQPKSKERGALQKAWEKLPTLSNPFSWDPALSGSAAKAPIAQPQSKVPMTLSEEIWKKIKTDLTKAALSRSRETLMNRIEQIRKDYRLNNKQQEWLEQFQRNLLQPLSVSAVQAPIISPQTGSGISEQEWKNLISYLSNAAENPSKELVEEIEKIKNNPKLSDKQREMLDGFQQTMQALSVPVASPATPAPQSSIIEEEVIDLPYNPRQRSNK